MHLFLKIFIRKLKKLLIHFQFTRNFFPKIVSYCVPLGHTLAKSNLKQTIHDFLEMWKKLNMY